MRSIRNVERNMAVGDGQGLTETNQEIDVPPGPQLLRLSRAGRMLPSLRHPAGGPGYPCVPLRGQAVPIFGRRRFVVPAFALLVLFWGSAFAAVKVGLDYSPPVLFSGFALSSAG